MRVVSRNGKEKFMGMMKKGLNERLGFKKWMKERMAEEILYDISTVAAKGIWGGEGGWDYKKKVK